MENEDKAIEKIHTDIENIDIKNELDVVDVIKKSCAKYGVTVEAIYKSLGEGIVAIKRSKTPFGDTIEEPDHLSRHKYIVTALELIGHLKKSGVNVDINNNFTFAQMVEVASKAKPVEVINDRP